ncbi:MAG: PHP domain-containing protein [Deltaproteobacteria bacterium]|nr:PHP domain-containing protein [Deltaproteobacteria bacterium]
MRNLREFHADLHIHTCLSPCASLDLSPRNIVDRAKFQGLDVIAITDHNTAKNAQVVMRLGEKGGIKVISGMEVQSREEIHLLTLFPDWSATAAWAEEVSRSLPEMNNDPLIFGDQPIVDEDGNILEFESRLLLNSLRLSAEEIIRLVAGKGGLTIPSHFHRPEEIGSGRTIFLMAEAALDELRLAFRNQEGRRLVKFIHNALDP